MGFESVLSICITVIICVFSVGVTAHILKKQELEIEKVKYEHKKLERQCIEEFVRPIEAEFERHGKIFDSIIKTKGYADV